MAESGKIILGRVQPRHLGQWDAARGYTVLDQVSYAGELWQCVAATTPGTAPTAANSAWWAKLSADATSVEALEQALAGKADASDLATVQEELGDKADASELAEVKAGLDDKLSLSGGTMTGVVKRKINSIDKEIAPSQVIIGQANILMDKNLEVIGSFEATQFLDKRIATSIYSSRYINDEWKFMAIHAMLPAEGNPYAAVSHPPRESAYANDIDTLRASINRHPIKIRGTKTIHVGGDNASDTADLFMGRGESADMPFASLAAAVSFACQNHYAREIVIELHADQEMGSPWFYLHGPRIILQGDSVRRTITSKGGISLAGGVMLIRDNLHFAAADGAPVLFRVSGGYGSRLIIESPVTFSGTVTLAAIYSYNGAFVHVVGNCSGEVTGKRYACANCGRIITGGKGPDFIPGTIAGTCDESSVYC